MKTYKWNQKLKDVIKDAADSGLNHFVYRKYIYNIVNRYGPDGTLSGVVVYKSGNV